MKDFKVGQIWDSSTGNRHEIIAIMGDVIITRFYKLGNNHVRSWDKEGKLYSSPSCVLVKEYKEPRKSKNIVAALYEDNFGLPYEVLRINKTKAEVIEECSRWGGVSKIIGIREFIITEGEGM